MELKQRAAEIVRLLEAEYPLAECTLDYKDAWELLVSVRLAAQCTDARVNIVTQELFRLYPTAQALATAPVEEIERIVRPCGLGNSKARDISACMKMICAKYGGMVPDTMEALLELPGVGRKSANLILGDVFGKPAIVTDTHCIRICGKLGLTDSKSPPVVERQLREIIDPEKGSDFCHRLVMHGRAVCIARSAQCEKCCLKELCPSAEVSK